MKSAASRVVPARARDGRLLAIRTWRSDARSMHDALQLAKLAMRVEHPLLAAILKCELQAESALTIVSEYVPGKTLDVWVGEHGLPAIGVAIDLVERLCRALHLLHLEGIAHHSLYPGNVIVGESDGHQEAQEAQIEAKLLDKGVPGIMRPWPPRLEAAHFMAPEALAAGRPFAATIEAEARMNVYSCGCLLHYLCTGQPPFQSVSSERLMAIHGLGQPAEPGQLSSSLPVALEQAIVRALAIEPQERFASCHALADVLALVEAPLRSSGVRRRVSVRPPPPPPARVVEVAPPPAHVSEPAPRRASVPPPPATGPLDWRSLVPPLVSGAPIALPARLPTEPHRLVPPLSAAQTTGRRRIVPATPADITLPAVKVPAKTDLRRRSLELPVARDGAAEPSSAQRSSITGSASAPEVASATPVGEPLAPTTEESLTQPAAAELAVSGIESSEAQAAEQLDLQAEVLAASLEAAPETPHVNEEPASAAAESPASEPDESGGPLDAAEREQSNVAPTEVHSAEAVATESVEAVASAELPPVGPVAASAEETSAESQPPAPPSVYLAAASSEESRGVLVQPFAVLADTVPEPGEQDSSGETLALRSSDGVISTFLRRSDPPRVVYDVRVERAHLPISRALGRRVIDATSPLEPLEPGAPRGRWLVATLAAVLLGIGYALTSWLGSSSTEQGVRAVSLAHESVPGVPASAAPTPPSAAGGAPPVASSISVLTPLPPLPAELQPREPKLAHTRGSAEGSSVASRSPERPVRATPNAGDERPRSPTPAVASQRDEKDPSARAPARNVTAQVVVPVAARRGSPNETQIAIEQLSVRGSIPPTRVLRAVERIRPHFTECYDAHGSRARLLPVRVDALVDEAGRVREASVDSGGTRALEACLSRATRKLTVRALDSTIRASWNLRITPGAPLPRYRGF